MGVKLNFRTVICNHYVFSLALILSGFTPPAILKSQPFSKVTFEKGDILIHGLKRLSLKRVVPPYHYMYALNDHELFHAKIIEKKNENGKKKFVALMRIVDQRKLGEIERRVRVKKVKKRKKPESLGDKSILLARRMTGLELPVYLFRCHCRHYLDYVIYGKTFGKWWKPTYLPVHPRCPLHRVITPETDLHDPNFQLQTKNGQDYCQLKSFTSSLSPYRRPSV